MQSIHAEAGMQNQKTPLTEFGQISFINTLPVVLPQSRGLAPDYCRLIFGTPQELNEKLRLGDLQLGAMSSFFYLQDGGFELFKDLSISGTGRVGSVLLFSKEDLRNLDGKEIEIPESSATSIKLLQLLLKEEFSAEPVLVKQSGLSPAESNARASLLIGDKALLEDLNGSSKKLLRIDLAQWWFKRFSLPFVFGLWGAR
ncbi:MAG: hypothetical protein K2X27_20890, partial [Candidatus Obscuribacterales bacterium]|nr:hypothetical protein [Candidatus Obscuribacterales bacterium]